MRKNRGKIGFVLFILFLIALICAGQYFYMMSTKEENTKEESQTPDYRIDKEKDYFYFINDEVLSESAEMFYRDVVINIKDQEHISEALNKENQIYKSNIKYISKQNLLSEDIVNYNNNDLYMLNYREYKTFKYNDTASLLIEDFLYDCFDLFSIKKLKSYIYNIKTGKLMSEEEILSRYNTNLEKVKGLIKTRLNEKQEIVDEEELIKIDETINKFDNYAFHIDDVGHLVITYLVKSNKTDFSDSITIE